MNAVAKIEPAVSAFERLDEAMAFEGIRRISRYKRSGFRWVELEDGRTGTGPTFRAAIEAAKAERMAA